jgi:acetylornithine deacetylase
VSAIEKGHAVARAVSDLEAIRIHDVSHSLYPDNLSSMPCMVTVFEAGSFPSAFPDSCLLKGSIATLPGEKTETVKQQFLDHVALFARTDPWLRNHPPVVTFKGYCGDSAEIPVDHPIVGMLTESMKTVTGQYPPVTGRQGAADTRYLIEYGGTPTVIFGPGPTEQMHATDEWVDLDDLIAGTKALALTIMEWCAVA